MDRNNLRTLFGVQEIPKDGQLRNIIDEVDPTIFDYFFEEYVRVLQRGKQLKKYEILPKLYSVSLDATGYFSSNSIHCPGCLTRTHEEEPEEEAEEPTEQIHYLHQALQVAIVHPDQRTVIPLMPEEIQNTDGSTKQDCETQAAKRLLPKLRKVHPHLGMLLVGDDLYCRQPLIEEAQSHHFHYLFVAKSSSHSYLQEWIDRYPKVPQEEYLNRREERYILEWMKMSRCMEEKKPLE